MTSYKPVLLLLLPSPPPPPPPRLKYKYIYRHAKDRPAIPLYTQLRLFRVSQHCRKRRRKKANVHERNSTPSSTKLNFVVLFFAPADRFSTPLPARTVHRRRRFLSTQRFSRFALTTHTHTHTSAPATTQPTSAAPTRRQSRARGTSLETTWTRTGIGFQRRRQKSHPRHSDCQQAQL